MRIFNEIHETTNFNYIFLSKALSLSQWGCYVKCIPELLDKNYEL